MSLKQKFRSIVPSLNKGHPFEYSKNYRYIAAAIVLTNKMMENNTQNIGNDEVREQVVQAARLVFARFGYKKTALDDIAREARKGKSTIYYYFKSKDEIFKAVIDAEAEIRKQAIQERINQISDSKLKLKTYIYVRMQTLKMVVNYYEAIKNDLLDNLYFVNGFRIGHFENEIMQVENMLLEGIEKEEFSIANPELTAKTIVTILQGFEVPLILKNLTDEEIRKSVDEMLNILFYGIAKNKIG